MVMRDWRIYYSDLHIVPFSILWLPKVTDTFTLCEFLCQMGPAYPIYHIILSYSPDIYVSIYGPLYITSRCYTYFHGFLAIFFRKQKLIENLFWRKGEMSLIQLNYAFTIRSCFFGSQDDRVGPKDPLKKGQCFRRLAQMNVCTVLIEIIGSALLNNIRDFLTFNELNKWR